MKSNVSDHIKLLQAIYIDACNKCIADVSDLRDMMTIRSRVESEGISFLTITLPRFCSDFEQSLASGIIDSTRFSGFRKRGSIPAFLQGMISQLFNHETGRIYDEKPEEAATIVESVRQICLTLKKIELTCTPQRVQASLFGFVQTEQTFKSFALQQEDQAEFLRVSSVLWDSCISSIKLEQCSPRHGPGATAERASGNQKYTWQRWHDRLEPYFPLIDCGFPLGTPLDSEELKNVTIVPEEDEQPVRVVCVPKTLKGPRIIAIEPCCMQYTQQGIRDVLYERIESSSIAGGHVNFRDQSVNQKLAILASSTGQLATIDLSDASDRVPRSLALEMFRSNPDLRDAIDSCRSTRAELPDGTIVSPLLKFASMGSALCFPVEAMYFYTICVMALLRANDLPVSHKNCFSVSRGIHVYGDDIVVPSTHAVTVLDYLRKYNCKVNVNKTFYRGNFRESCGVDAYCGYEVTPTYLTQDRPENRQQASRLISWVSAANSFYKRGYWRTASFLFQKVERFLGPLPYVSEESGGLGRISFLGYRSVHRWQSSKDPRRPNYQRFEVKCWVPEPVYHTDKLEGYGALTKSFLKLDDLKNRPVSRDALHLERSALHGAVALKRRWLPVT